MQCNSKKNQWIGMNIKCLGIEESYYYMIEAAAFANYKKKEHARCSFNSWTKNEFTFEYEIDFFSSLVVIEA